MGGGLGATSLGIIVNMRLLFLILTLSITFSSCKQNENKVQSLSRNISSTDSSSTITKVNSRLKKYYEDYLKRVLNKKQNNYNPIEGVIPDSITAVKIAEIILSKIYGEKNIIAEKPFSALLKD